VCFGSLEVIVGPMFSGKTDELINRFELATAEGAPVVAIKPARDTRDPADLIVSHSGRRIPATAIASVDEIREVGEGRAVVLIDEIQFFDPPLREAVVALRQSGGDVVAAGLDLDFARAPFETTRLLLGEASVARRLAATCGRCGKAAVLTQRFADGQPAALDSPTFVVGDAELYEPRCEACWLEERSISRT
jgi:thymidine kinase